MKYFVGSRALPSPIAPLLDSCVPEYQVGLTMTLDLSEFNFP